MRPLGCKINCLKYKQKIDTNLLRFRDEIEADQNQREDENPLAYSNNKNKYL